MQLAFLPIAVLALLVAACGGGKGSEQKTPTATPGAPATLEGLAKDYYETVLRGYSATFKVTYETRSSDGTQGDTTVIYSKPPFSRRDTVPAGSTIASSTLISRGRDEKGISCSHDQNWKCSAIDPLADSLLRTAGPVVFLEPTDLVSYTVTEEERRMIAGQDARCFKLQPKPPDEEPLEYCFNSNGVPLYSAPLFGTVEATEYTADVADDAFTPPAQPQPR